MEQLTAQLTVHRAVTTPCTSLLRQSSSLAWDARRYAFKYYLCRLAAIDALDELAMAAPEREWRLIEVDASLADVDRHRRHILGKHPISCISPLLVGKSMPIHKSCQQ